MNQNHLKWSKNFIPESLFIENGLKMTTIKFFTYEINANLSISGHMYCSTCQIFYRASCRGFYWGNGQGIIEKKGMRLGRNRSEIEFLKNILQFVHRQDMI